MSKLARNAKKKNFINASKNVNFGKKFEIILMNEILERKIRLL